MFIAVSNANGWGRGLTIGTARANAFHNSHSRDNPAFRVKVWPCSADARVDHNGDALGVTGEAREYRRNGKLWELVTE